METSLLEQIMRAVSEAAGLPVITALLFFLPFFFSVSVCLPPKPGSNSDYEKPKEYTWPADGISTRIPTPPFPPEDIWTHTDFPEQFPANTTTSSTFFEAYVPACKEQGFCLEETDFSDRGEDFISENIQVFDAEGYRLQLRYNGTEETGHYYILEK